MPRWLTLLTLMFLAAPVIAAEPAIRAVNVRGLQIGGTTTLVIDGDNFGKAPRLLLPHPATQTLKPASTDKQATFDVALPADSPAGYWNLRVVTEGGVSLPVLIGVDRLPQKALSATVESVPIALHGAVNGATPAVAKFVGKGGQLVIVEVEAQRLGSKLRPVVHLLAPNKVEVAWSWGKPSLWGDARIEATLPTDGEYSVSVHDVEYGPQSPSHFRLKIGQWAYVDQVFPPFVQRGQPANFELLGSTSIKLPATPFARVGVEPLALAKDLPLSGPRPFARISATPELMEPAEAGKVHALPAGLCAVTGKLATPNEEDRYKVPVKAGTKVRFEVFAERLGSPIDVSLTIRNEMGADLAKNEDAPGTTDAAIEYAVPVKTEHVVVAVTDAQGTGSPRGIYRLVVAPKNEAGDDDFRLRTTKQRIGVSVGGFAAFPITIDRTGGYEGPIQLAADKMPAGFAAENTLIPEGGEGAIVVVRRPADAGSEAILRWKGTTKVNDERDVSIVGHPLERLQPWLASEVALAPIAAKASDYQIDWKDLPPDAGLVQAGKPSWQVKLVKPNEKVTTKLTLLTSQPPKLVNGQPDANAALRFEKAIEVPGKEMAATIPILVPPELRGTVYDVTIEAEFLDEKKQPLAFAYAPVRRMAVRESLVVKLDGPNVLDAAIDPKAGVSYTLKGKIERKEGLTGEVTLAFANLPPGVAAAPLAVKADKSDFEVKLTAPVTQPLGEFRSINLTASGVPDAKQANVRVKSRDVELTLRVLEAKK
ncbi:MAG: hypothetical protein U0744_07880 [Gemmataceae bacterium]